MFKTIPLVEPAIVPDTFISGISRIEYATAGVVRLTFFTVQEDLDGQKERLVVLRVVMTESDMKDCARHVLKFGVKEMLKVRH